MGEGKTTTSANLAVAFAESGRRACCSAATSGGPSSTTTSGVQDAPGLTEELAKPPEQQSLANIIVETGISGVRLAPSGEPVEHPGELLARGLDLIASASNIADVVVIDTAPLLATDDASVLIPLADAVVVVCRPGENLDRSGDACRELLARVSSAPLVGRCSSVRSSWHRRVPTTGSTTGSRGRSRSARPRARADDAVAMPTDVGSAAPMRNSIGGGAGRSRRPRRGFERISR